MQKKFMKKNEQKKFELFKQLVFHPKGITIQEVINQNNDAKSTVYRYIQQLNDDLDHLFTNEKAAINQNINTFFVFLANDLNVGYALDSLKFYYVSISPEYIILNAITGRNFPSLEAMSQEINLSTSYTYRNINSLNKAFKPFNVKISFGDSAEKTNLYGEEKDIRFFLFFTYWNLLKGLTWPFEKAPDNYRTLPLTINTHLGPSQTTRFRYFQNITLYRMLFFRTKVHVSSDFTDYLAIFDQTNPTCFSLDLSKVLTEKETTDEQLYFGFLCRFFIPDIDSLSLKREAAKKFICSNLPLTISCDKLLTLLIDTMNLSVDENQYYRFYYDLMIALLYIEYIDIDYEAFLETEESISLLGSDTIDFPKLEQQLNQLLIDFSTSDPYLKKIEKTGFLSNITNLLCSFMSTAQEPTQVTIFCQYSKNYYMNTIIQNAISSMFDKQTIHFTEDISSADIIISDCYEGSVENTKFFYFDTPFRQESWRALSQFVNSYIHDIRLYKNI